MQSTGKQQGQKVRLQDSRSERNFKYETIYDLKSMSYIKLFSNPPLTIEKAVDLSGIFTLPNKDDSSYLSYEYQ